MRAAICLGLNDCGDLAKEKLSNPGCAAWKDRDAWPACDSGDDMTRQDEGEQFGMVVGMVDEMPAWVRRCCLKDRVTMALVLLLSGG